MAEKGKAKEVAQNDDAMAEAIEIITAEVETLRPSQRAVLAMLQRLEDLATEDTDSRPFGEDIAAILLAETETDMWEGDELPRINAKVLAGCELETFGFEVKFSNSEDVVTGLIGPRSLRKMYLLVHSVRLNNSGQVKAYNLPKVGEEFFWNTSARYVVAKFFWLLTHGAFDNQGTVKAKLVGTKLDGAKEVVKLQELSAATIAQAAEAPF
jgi:hypothetical protein